MSVVVTPGENRPYKMYLRVHSAQNISTLTQGSYCKLYLGDTVMVGGSSANKGGSLANLLHSDAHHDPGAPMARVTFRTKVHYPPQKSNPVWNEKFEVGVIDPSTEILSIRVKSQQMLYCPSVGACAIPLKQLKLGESVDQSVPLYKGHKPAGHIRLQILLANNTVGSPNYTAPQFQFRGQQSFQQQQLHPQQSLQQQQFQTSSQQQPQYQPQPSFQDHEAMEQRALDLLSEKHKQEQILLQKQQRLAEAQARELEIERNRRIAVEKELERLRRMSAEPSNVVQNPRSNSTPPNYYGVVQDEQELAQLRRQSAQWKQARSNSVAPKSYHNGLKQEDQALGRLRRMSSGSRNARASTPKAYNGIEQDNQTAHLVSAFANTKLQNENANPQQLHLDQDNGPVVLPAKTFVPAPKGWDDAPPPPSYETTVSSSDLPPPSYNETASTCSRLSTPSKNSHSVYSDVVNDALPSDESSDSSTSEEERRRRRKEKKKRRRAKKKAKKLKRKMKREERKMRKKFGLDSGAEELSGSDSDSDSSSESSSSSASTSSGESRRRRLKNKHQELDRARAASASVASRHSSRRLSTPRKKSSRSASLASDYQAEPGYPENHAHGYSQPKWEVTGYIISDDEQADMPRPTRLQSVPSSDVKAPPSYQVSNLPLSESTNVASNMMNPSPPYNATNNAASVETDSFDETTALPTHLTHSFSNVMSFHSEASSDADHEFHVPAFVPGGHKRYSTQDDFLDSQRSYDDDNTIGFAEGEEGKMDNIKSNLQHSNSLDIDELIKQHQEEFGKDDSTDSVTSAPGGGFFGAISPTDDGAAFFVEPSHYSQETERSVNDTSNNSFCF